MDNRRGYDQDDVAFGTTELGSQGGKTFDVAYDPEAQTVTIKTPDGPETFSTHEGEHWRQQAERELAARGYGSRWSRWETADDGTFVISAARRRDPGTPPGPAAPSAPQGQAAADPGAVWVPGDDAASWTSTQLKEPAAPQGGPIPTGRVRVYPQYRYPVHGVDGDQEITVTDWRKQGRDWADAEARRQVEAALGPAGEGDDRSWWVGKAAKEQYRWHPWKGTPRDALPVNPDEQPAWRPELPAGGQPAAPPSDRDAKIMYEAIANHDGVVPPGVQGFEDLAAAGLVDEQGRVTTVGQQRARDYVSTSAGLRHFKAVDTSLEPVNAYQAPDVSPGRPGEGAAEYEEQLSPEEQERRYDQRREHYRAWRGDDDEPAAGYGQHAAACSPCSDFDRGGDGAGRRLRVVAKPGGDPGDLYPVQFTFMGGADADEVSHERFEAVMDSLNTNVAAYSIPDDLTGVLDVDSFIASIGPLMVGVSDSMHAVSESLGGGQSPVHASVCDMLADFCASLTAMAQTAQSTHRQWQSNPDNEHDLRRARGEIPNASLFNVDAVGNPAVA